MAGQGHPASQGYSSEENLGQSHCGAKCLPFSPSADVVTTHLATSLYLPMNFQLMKGTYDLVSAQQTAKPSCPLSNSVFSKATGQSNTSIELKLILRNVRLPMLSTWVEKNPISQLSQLDLGQLPSPICLKP